MTDRAPVLTTRQFVQPGLGTTVTAPGGELRSLWIELPAWCDLLCPYCFAGTRRRDPHTNNLSFQEYEGVIREFAQLGGKDIGIPGAGEPFHARSGGRESNRALTLKILELCRPLGISVTVFTTGHWIDTALARDLFDYDVVLLVKFNSIRMDVQNALVGGSRRLNYAAERNEALFRLIYRGFNKPAFGKNSRLGVVTSVLNANKTELPWMLRFARNNNLIFDCDTILRRGRGAAFDDAGGTPRDDEMKQIFETLQKIDAEEFGNYWDISRSYVGTCCDRFRHHVYVTRVGDVHPCVGATAVELGNIRRNSLAECWDNSLMRLIRNQSATGKCTTCANFIEQKCYSCLGRCTDELSTKQLQRDGHVCTTGCWNYRPSLGEG
jgi:MoaA/NifB/PqqE/SkfB family radical SAM enzyme